MRIVSPAKGTRVQGSRTDAKAEVVVPDGRILRSLEFRVNDQLITSLTKPPWQAEVPVPEGDLVYMTAVATLDDGSHVEALRYLRAPENVSEVDVDLVELYAAVTDRSGNLVNDLKQNDFEVYEAGKRHFAKEELRQWFSTLYEVLLGSSQGPRMGAFIKLYGRDNVVRLINRALAGEDLSQAA